MLSLRSHRVGDVDVTRIPEVESLPFEARELLPAWSAAELDEGADWMAPAYVDASRATVMLGVHSWLLRIEGRTVLVDAGIGNGKAREAAMFDRLDSRFLERLASAGVSPTDVDDVLLTHLHIDHVGWLTRGSTGEPTFPNARVFMPRVEQAHRAALLEELGPDAPGTRAYADSVVPILDRTTFVEAPGGEVLPGLTYLPTPGHSVGHMSIELASRGECGLFAGDVMHHPSQVVRPGWNSMFSEDPPVGRASRQWLLERAADRRALVFSSHFPAPSAGVVDRVAGGFRWAFADGTPVRAGVA